MKKIVLLFTAVIFSANGFGQVTFQKTYGGVQDERGYSVQQTSDGGYVITGFTGSVGASGGYNIYLVKTNSDGDTLWTKSYSGVAPISIGFSVQQTTDGGYVIAGYSEGLTPYLELDLYLIKTNAVGDTLWTRTFAGIGGANHFHCSIIQTTDGGYCATGFSQASGPGYANINLVKLNNNGDSLWTKTIRGFGCNIAAYSIRQTPDGGYILAGIINAVANGGLNALLVKTDSNGNIIWNKTYGGGGNDFAYSVQLTEEGGYIFAGATSSCCAGSSDVSVVKTDSAGNVIWAKTYGGAGSDWGYYIQRAEKDGFIITGMTSSFSSSFDAYLISINGVGDTLWTRTFGGQGDDAGNWVEPTTDGGYIIGGNTTMGSGYGDFYLIKTDGNGNSGCHQNNTTTNIGAPIWAVVAEPTIINSGLQMAFPVISVTHGGMVNNLCINTNINEISDDNSALYIYPNPSLTDIFNVTTNAELINARLEILNVVGEKIYSDSFIGFTKQIFLDGPKGIYFITVTDQAGNKVTRKVVKM